MTAIATFRTRLANELLRDPNNRIRPVSTLDYAINAGYTRTQEDTMWMIPLTDDNETITWVSGTQEYTFATDLKTIKLIRRSGNDLLPTTKEAIKAKYATMESGIPVYYYIYQNSIWLYPIPLVGWTIDIDYTNILPTITDSVASSNPSYLDDAILYHAASVCYRQVGRVDMAQIRDIEYEKTINKSLLNLVRQSELYFT